MSSTYHAICLSHDPGLTLDPEFTYEKANTLNSRDQLGDHQHCDIVIGRFSYPLIEVACLGTQLPGPSGCKAHHRGPEWADADWLRLLHAATPHVDAAMLDRHTFRCWPGERLRRLRDELGLTELPAKDDAAEARSAVAKATPPELHDAIRTLARLDPVWWRTEVERMNRMYGHANLLGGTQ